MPVLKIPPKLEYKYPSLRRKELRLVLTMIIKSINMRLRKAYIVDFKVRGLGTFKSHGNRKKKNFKKLLIKDKLRKRKKQEEKENLKENLLW